ncbi:TPA: hypothetical protein R2M39_001635 [Campylobacter jejuni]|nr:hypothetical protein [Campylobacter jejuni]
MFSTFTLEAPLPPTTTVSNLPVSLSVLTTQSLIPTLPLPLLVTVLPFSSLPTEPWLEIVKSAEPLLTIPPPMVAPSPFEISRLLSLLLVIEPLIPVDEVEVFVIESSLPPLSTTILPEILPLPVLVIPPSTEPPLSTLISPLIEPLP